MCGPICTSCDYGFTWEVLDIVLYIKYLWSHCSTYFLKYSDLEKPHTAAPMTLKETKRPNKVQAVEQVPAGTQKGRI